MASWDSDAIRRRLQVEPGTAAGLAERDPAWKGGRGQSAKGVLDRDVRELADAQELLWASRSHAVLVVLQAMDAAGKDSTIEHVMSGVNPQGVKVVSFKQPTPEELDHDFLWRVSRALPERGHVGIFNRSHYEEVVAVRVHPEWLALQHLPPGPRGRGFWRQRYGSINAFEQHLDRAGTRIVKFFLHVSRAEQKRRFLARLDEPEKAWKFSAADVAERRHWDAYMSAYEEAITATSTPWAPWHVIPANSKPVMHALVAGILLDAIESLGLAWPEVSDEARAEFAAARRQLASEPEDGE